MASTDEVLLQDGDNLSVTLRGVGWGRLVVQSTVNATMNVTLAHDTFELDGNLAPALAAYDPANHTHIYFFPEGGAPTEPDSFSFEWRGLPSNATPNFVGSTRGSIQVSPGQSGVVLVATTVTGFRLQLQLGTEVRDAARDWKLAPHAGHWLAAPAPTVAAALDEGVARIAAVRDWSTGNRAVGPSLLIANQWTISFGDSSSAGVIKNELAIREQRPADDPRRGLSVDAPNNPVVPVGGGYFFVRLLVTEPKNIEMYRHHERSTIGSDDQVYGASFLAIPLSA